ncbi:MAG: hypothetical protein ACE5GN_05935 [Waddliaceae bacterium]
MMILYPMMKYYGVGSPPWNVKRDNSGTPIRPNSSAFKEGAPPMSVDIASLSSVKQTLSGHENFHIAAFTAGQAREIGCKVVRNPLPDNSAHALVIGSHKSYAVDSLTGRLTDGQANKLSKLCSLIS